MGSRPLNNPEWESELNSLIESLKTVEICEMRSKSRLRELESQVKEQKGILRRETKTRRSLQKKVRTFWKRKRVRIYQQRQFVKNNLGRALDNIGI